MYTIKNQAQALVQAPAPPLLVEPKEQPLKARFRDLYFGKLYLDAIGFASNAKTISIYLEPTERIALRLRPFFFGMVLALAGQSTNAGMPKKKGRMLLYPGKNSRSFFVKIAAILGPL